MFFFQGARNFGTWMSYLTNFGEHKARIPVSKKRGLSWRYFHFLLSLNDYPPSQNPLSIGLWRMQRMASLTYPVYRLDLALLSAVVLFHHWFPQLEKIDNSTFILPRNFPAVLIIFVSWGGELPSPQYGASRNPSPPRRAGRRSLVSTPFFCAILPIKPYCHIARALTI